MAVQRFYLLLGIFIFVLCISNSTSVAPGDFDEVCLDAITRIPVSPNEKVLLDSQDYESQYLITYYGESNIWKSIDFDGIDMGGTYNQVSFKILMQLYNYYICIMYVQLPS